MGRREKCALRHCRNRWLPTSFSTARMSRRMRQWRFRSSAMYVASFLAALALRTASRFSRGPFHRRSQGVQGESKEGSTSNGRGSSGVDQDEPLRPSVGVAEPAGPVPASVCAAAEDEALTRAAKTQ